MKDSNKISLWRKSQGFRIIILLLITGFQVTSLIFLYVLSEGGTNNTWWFDTLFFIGGTILLGLISSVGLGIEGILIYFSYEILRSIFTPIYTENIEQYDVPDLTNEQAAILVIVFNTILYIAWVLYFVSLIVPEGGIL